ncbi:MULTISPECIES: hypothetical protein [unclassified Synechocystis]|uniref:hypothetical protein n=1 Tax=unclassified Synechocystis TaxID=2640012 RepID=UPI00040DDD24|nr:MULTISPECIES: hypothetical protein [unclassified Synechocystis]AIE75596.1 hypothetical protein D082_30680 [Synechocystis sp. PCC 6714]MCT0253794.1 hypothetical protein [Synechocystis sp. CS-94]
MLAKYFSEPIDRAALSLIGFLSAAIAVVGVGHYTCENNNQCLFANRPKVQSFSWDGANLGAQDRAFIMTFDRPIDQREVEKNLVITPALPGKISWAGRRMAYTLENPIPYGTDYDIQITNVREQYAGQHKSALRGRQGQMIAPFSSSFRSRDRAFAYIGTQGIEQGRIVFYNLTKQRKTILTPPGLTVVEFKFYDQGKGILFAAAESQLGFEGLRQLQLYQIPVVESDNPQELPKPTLVLDNQEFQNNQFDVSDDGKAIVVQRVNRQNPADFDLWIVKNQQKPERLKVQGGDFQIAPDNQSLAVARGEGIGILPLQPEARPLDFLPKFGQLLNFSADGSAAALVNFNTEDAQKRFQRTLFFVNNLGVQKELVDTDGSIVSCEFGRNNQTLYCLLTKLLPGDEYIEQPYFVQIDINSGEVFPLLKLQDYRDTKMSLSPDGLALLFDQVIIDPDTPANSRLNTDGGEAIADSQLWLLIPPLKPETGQQAELKALSLMGFRPLWAP